MKKKTNFSSSTLSKIVYECRPIIKFYTSSKRSKQQKKITHCSLKLPNELARYYHKNIELENEVIKIRSFKNCFVCDLKFDGKKQEFKIDKELLNEVKKLVDKEKKDVNYEEILHKTLLEIILSYSLSYPHVIAKISKKHIEWIEKNVKKEILRKLERELGCSLTFDDEYLYFEFDMDETRHGFNYAKSAYEKIVKTLKILTSQNQKELTKKINDLDERAIRQNEHAIDEVYSQYMNHLWIYAEPIFCPYFVITVELLSDEIEKIVYLLKKINKPANETLEILFRHITLCNDSLALYDKIFDDTNKSDIDKEGFSVYHFKIEEGIKEKRKKAIEIIYLRRKYDVDFQIDNLKEEESKILYAPLYRVRSLASILASLYLYLGVSSETCKELSCEKQEKSSS
ncbi:MAG TPA: hypothetical protein ENI51_12225 [Candidatus Atribacteria bacterium]|nr:hypothetical protein [Candidatus Atribacteria bacterium]